MRWIAAMATLTLFSASAMAEPAQDLMKKDLMVQAAVRQAVQSGEKCGLPSLMTLTHSPEDNTGLIMFSFTAEIHCDGPGPEGPHSVGRTITVNGAYYNQPPIFRTSPLQVTVEQAG